MGKTDHCTGAKRSTGSVAKTSDAITSKCTYPTGADAHAILSNCVSIRTLLNFSLSVQLYTVQVKFHHMTGGTNSLIPLIFNGSYRTYTRQIPNKYLTKNGQIPDKYRTNTLKRMNGRQSSIFQHKRLPHRQAWQCDARIRRYHGTAHGVNSKPISLSAAERINITQT